MQHQSDPGDGIDPRPSPSPPVTDAHGHAALLLAESTLHALIETNVLSNSQAVAIVRTAVEVEVDAARTSGDSDGPTQHAIHVLSRIEQSLLANDDGTDRPEGTGAA